MRKAFSIIELILSIIILAICSMAIPTMLAQISKSNDFAIQQELILNAKTAIAEVLRVPWDSSYLVQGPCEDAKDKVDCSKTNYTPVPIFLENIPKSDPFYNRPGLTKLGDPTIDDSYKNFGLFVKYKAALQSEFGKSNKDHSFGYYDYGETYNDVDDYNNAVMKFERPKNEDGDSTGDFLINTQINIKVNFINDSDGLSPTNLANAQKVEAVLPSKGENVNISNIKRVDVTAFNSDIKDKPTDPTNEEAQFVVLRGYAFNIGSTYVRVRGWIK